MQLPNSGKIITQEFFPQYLLPGKYLPNLSLNNFIHISIYLSSVPVGDR
jgi:hypothetical protein